MSVPQANGPKSIKNGWFTEISDKHFPGQGLSLKVDEVLYYAHSEFQEILVFKSSNWGNVLVLDGIIQCTERDEFAYQEMISHVPLFAHHNPKRVLVIGGGDGGVIREVVKHSCVESVSLVEIDSTVIELAKQYLPNMSCALYHEKVTIHLRDGFQYLREVGSNPQQDKYDVIITDSSDPDGPAEAFFQREYFQLMNDALKDDGILIAQASENVWLDINYLSRLVKTARSVFENTRYCYTTVPTYTSGQLGLIICAKDSKVNLTNPRRTPSSEEQQLMRYYNPQIHYTSFILPTWADRLVYDTN